MIIGNSKTVFLLPTAIATPDCESRVTIWDGSLAYAYIVSARCDFEAVVRDARREVLRADALVASDTDVSSRSTLL